jgi:hypothetical protein
MYEAGVDTVLFMSACPDDCVKTNDWRLAEEVVPLPRRQASVSTASPPS